MASAYRGFPVSSFQAIKGWDDAAAGKATSVSGITAPDDNTVVITLTAADSEFMSNLAAPQHSIMPQHILKDATKDTIEKIPFSTTSPIGTGPYKFVHNDSDTQVEVGVNPDYFKGAPKIQKIFMVKVAPEVASAQLQSGEIDLVTVASIFDLAALQADPKLTVITPQPIDIHAVYLNNTLPALRDMRIIQAIYYGVDRKTIAEQVLNGIPRVLNNPPGFKQDYPDVNQYPFDPDKAKQLLKDANFPFDKPFRISYPSTTAVWVRVFPIVQKYLQDIGINATLAPKDDTAWLNDITKTFDDWEMSVHTGGFEGLSPAISGIYYTCAGFFVKTLDFDSKTFCEAEKLFTAARREPDTTKREDIYHQIAKLLNDNPQREMWWSLPETIVFNKRLHGLKPYAQTQRVLSNIETWTLDQ
jgi:peptide/nickel transport system substrate-binding protein